MPTFYDRFVECSERWPSNVALEIQRHDRLESVTYADLRRMAESVGRWITENRFERGSRLAILADNHPRWVAAYLGIIAAGCAAVPLDTALHDDQATKLLKDSDASAIFCDFKHLSVVRAAVDELKLTLILTDPDHATNAAAEQKREAHRTAELNWKADVPSIFNAGPGNFKPAPAKDDDLASLIYTSGTTADPKGVMLTQGNLLAEVETVTNWVDVGPTDALLGVLPLFHVLAQMSNLFLPLVRGSRVVYLETLNTAELLRALNERSITIFAIVPQFFYLIYERITAEIKKRGAITGKLFVAMVKLNHALRKVGINLGPILFGKIHQTFGPKMRFLFTGGSRFDSEIGWAFYDLGLDIMQGYGLTETTAAIFANTPKDNEIGSVGKAMKNVEAKIIDPKPQEEGGPAVGEVAVRGPVVMKGYWNRPDATSAVLRDGWFYTGDLGYFDSHGHLFLTGRQKEVIVLANGKNIYPEEIEAYYLKSPFIKELAVIGLEGKGGEGGRLHAVIVPNFDVLRQRKVVNAKEVIRFDVEGLSQQLASTKRIGSYEIWQEDLPRTTTRKIKRFEVEKRVKANAAKKLSDDDADLPAEKPLTEDESAWLERPEVQRGLKVMKEAAHNAPATLRPSHNLELDLGLDSMQRVELLSQLESELGGNVDESQLANIYTVRDLLDAVLESDSSGKAAPRAAFAGWKAIFSEEPTDPEVLALNDSRPSFGLFWFPFSRVLQMIWRDLFHLRVYGLENLPQHGPFILSSNHQSYIDPVVLASVLPRDIADTTFAVGTSEVFGTGFMRRLARWLRVIVLDPDANLVPAMRAGAYGLRHGGVLILYPEGERSIDGKPRIFKKGAAILSIHMQVPIVPIAIEGFYEAWPRGKSFFQKIVPLKMVIGKPIAPPPESEASEETYEKFTAELKGRIVTMWEELQNK